MKAEYLNFNINKVNVRCMEIAQPEQIYVSIQVHVSVHVRSGAYIFRFNPPPLGEVKNMSWGKKYEEGCNILIFIPYFW